MTDLTPLGYIELPTGKKSIFPMNDVFTNYTFENPKNWKVLRDIANIYTEFYISFFPKTTMQLITKRFMVKTQYKHFLEEERKTRNQDLRIIEFIDDAKIEYEALDEKYFKHALFHALTYIELQISPYGIPVRSTGYFGLAIGYSRGKPVNQIWLLANDVEDVLHGETFARFQLIDEKDGTLHPCNSGILYVSLQKLSEQKDTRVGQLSALLLGKITEPEDEVVKQIAVALTESFETFKQEKDVVNVLTLLERGKAEGLAEGEAMGEAKGIAKGKAEGIDNTLRIAKALMRGCAPEDVAKELELPISAVENVHNELFTNVA